MHIRLLLVIFCLSILSCKKKFSHPHVEIQTKLGGIEVELYPEKAPKTVAAFLSYVDSGLYRNATFYRVLNLDNQPSDAYKAELIQGGIWKTDFKRFNAIP